MRFPDAIGLYRRPGGVAVATVPVAPIVLPPLITTPANITLNEGVGHSIALTANEAGTWTKTGGPDQGPFVLNGASLLLGPRSFNSPVDTDANNTYLAQLTFTSDLTGLTAVLNLVVTIRAVLGALTLSTNITTQGAASTINILGAKVGSTITGTVPAGMTLNSAARTITGTPTTPTTAETQLRALTQTLAGAVGSPRTDNVEIIVNASGNPTLTAPPAISSADPVVGDVLAAAPATWSAVPTGRAYQWQRAGADIPGATSNVYTVVDADAAQASRGALTVVETPTFASGTVGPATSPATAIPRRTRATFAYHIGSLTKQDYGQVPLASPQALLGAGALAPTTANWLVGAATAGNSAHWTRTAGNTPRPSGGGASAQLSSGTYVFPVDTGVFSDGLAAEQSTITITIRPNVATLGLDNPGTMRNQIVAAGQMAQLVAIEIATGLRSSLQAWQSGIPTPVIGLDGWEPAQEVFVRYADPSRPSRLSGLNITGCHNFTVDGIWLGGTVQTGASSYISQRLILGGNTAGTANGVNCKANNVRIISDPDNVRATPTTPNELFGVRVDRQTGWQVNDVEMEHVNTAFSVSVNSVATGVINRPKVRYFYNNAMIFGQSTAGGQQVLEINDAIYMSPMRLSNVDGLHLDFGQVSDGTRSLILRLNRVRFYQADGNANCQGVFHGATADDPTNPTETPHVEANGMIICMRTQFGLQGMRGYNSSYRNLTVWRSDGAGDDPGTIPGAGGPPAPTGPGLSINPTDYAQNGGANTIENALVYGVLQGTHPSWTVINSRFLGGTRATVPDTSAIFANPPRAVIEALPFATMTLEEVDAAHLAALTPLPGVTDGALTPSGAWRT